MYIHLENICFREEGGETIAVFIDFDYGQPAASTVPKQQPLEGGRLSCMYCPISDMITTAEQYDWIQLGCGHSGFTMLKY